MNCRLVHGLSNSQIFHRHKILCANLISNDSARHNLVCAHSYNSLVVVITVKLPENVSSLFLPFES